MFTENKGHLQHRLFSSLDELTDSSRKKFSRSWATTFYEEVFIRLDEEPLAILYSEKASRPNVPANVLVGLEILKAGNGWSDEEAYESFLFDLRTRYALGYEQLGDGDFSIRTLYEFRRRLREHMETTGEHLIEQVFVQITDEQMREMSIKNDMLRMDSTQIASNIYQYDRIELLVELVERVHRILAPEDRERFHALFAPYTTISDDEPYSYRLRSASTTEQLEATGNVIATLVDELRTEYGQEPAYEMLVRALHEHFDICGGQARAKPYKEVGRTSLQSPDDPEATFRRKRGKRYRGYACHVTETCNPDNNLQLIISVHTEPNTTDDAQMLIKTLPELIERTDVTELYTDGGYNSPALDPFLAEISVEHIQTALRGDRPPVDRINLMDFDIETDVDGTPIHLICPLGQRFPVELGQEKDRFIGRPDKSTCLACPLLSRCAVRPKKTNRTPSLYFDERQKLVALKRKAMAVRASSRGNIRNAIESTMHSLKHRLRQDKLSVRGKLRASTIMLGSALMANLRRIHRHMAQTVSGAIAHPPPLNWGRIADEIE